jgi:hypothetical protein
VVYVLYLSLATNRPVETHLTETQYHDQLSEGNKIATSFPASCLLLHKRSLLALVRS